MTPVAISLMLAASYYGLPAGMLQAVCTVESGLNPQALHRDDGHSNSVGLCQIKLKTAQWMGYHQDEHGLYDPATNALYSARYLKHLLTRYAGNEEKAVAAYNAGHYRACGKAACNSKYVAKVFHEWRKHDLDRSHQKRKEVQTQGWNHRVLDRKGQCGTRQCGVR